MTARAKSRLVGISAAFSLFLIAGAGALDAAAVGVSKTKGGYIDSAVVTTQFRLRFDAAFDGNRADRAEFFYGKCFCFGVVANQDGAGSPGPAESFDFQEMEVGFEWALPQFDGRFSILAELPVRWIDVNVPANLAAPLGLPSAEITESGLGDLRLGAKFGLVAESDRAWTLQIRTYLPTGKADKGLGTDHASIEPGLLYYRELTKRLSVETELRYWIPLSGSPDPFTVVDGSRVLRVVPEGTEDPATDDDFAGEVVRFGVGAAYEFSLPSKISLAPVVELVGWRVLDGFATDPTGAPEDASDTSIANLKLGLRITDRKGRSFFAGYGLALTEDIWYDDIIRFEYRQPLAWR